MPNKDDTTAVPQLQRFRVNGHHAHRDIGVLEIKLFAQVEPIECWMRIEDLATMGRRMIAASEALAASTAPKGSMN